MISGVFDLGTLDLSGAKATGADVYCRVGSVNNGLYLTNVRLPSSIGLTVRVGNVMSEGNALTANTALSHFDTSKILPVGANFICFFI